MVLKMFLLVLLLNYLLGFLGNYDLRLAENFKSLEKTCKMDISLQMAL